jgi:hypothetical protein
MPKTATRRYSIEIRDLKADKTVLLTAVDWEEEDRRVALAQVMRLAGLPGANSLTKPTEPVPKRRPTAAARQTQR